MINSPWFKSDVETFSEESKTENNCGNSEPEAKNLNEATALKMVETGPSFVRTRAQKRKLSFKENREVEVSFSVLLLHPVLCS